jgi:hypothetical protein
MPLRSAPKRHLSADGGGLTSAFYGTIQLYRIISMWKISIHTASFNRGISMQCVTSLDIRCEACQIPPVFLQMST